MGSASTEKCTQNGHVVSENAQRPLFFPCPDCGHKFTKRALEIHKKSCSEDENCRCFVCKPDKRKRLRDSEEQCHEERKPQYNENEILIKNKFEAYLTASLKQRDDLQIRKDLQNSQIDQKNHFILLYPGTAVSSLENVMNDDKDKLADALQNCSDVLDSYHDGEPCGRKLFCSVCSNHVHWKIFGTHALQHCIKSENNHLQCPACSDSRSSPTYFLMHFFSHISSHPSDCPQCRCGHPKCSEVSSVPLAEHCYAESVDHHRCYICLKVFGHFQSLINHMRLHSKEMPFICTECKRSFRQIGNLQRHMTTHRGDRPHKCPKCCRSFADPATLRNHVRVHTRETPYVCSTCKRGFSQVGNLKRHMALHVQKEANAIKILNGDKNGILQPVAVAEEVLLPASTGSQIAANENSSLNNPHNEPKPEGATVNGESVTGTEDPKQELAVKSSPLKGRRKNGNFRLFPCPKCGKKYAWKHDLNIHYRTHTGEKPYKCEICDKRFAQSGAVRIHKIRHHTSAPYGKPRWKV